MERVVLLMDISFPAAQHCVKNFMISIFIHVHESLIDVLTFYFPVFSITNDDLLISHINEWKTFWNDFRIEIDGDDELVR